jgi:N-methylhydantoinase A
MFGRTIPGLIVEAVNWTLRLAAAQAPPAPCPPTPAGRPASPRGKRSVFDPDRNERVEVAVYWRADLRAGDRMPGPAILAEDETSTFISRGFTAHINALGYILLEKEAA